jgi:hypothetical protein
MEEERGKAGEPFILVVEQGTHSPYAYTEKQETRELARKEYY